MANEIRDAFNAVYVDGPSGSPTEPQKAEIRSIGGVIQGVTDDLTARLGEVEGIAGGLPGEVDALEERVDAVEDTVESGVKPAKKSVRLLVESATAPSAMTAGATLDGLVLVANDRVARAVSPADAINGVYVVQAAGAAIRASDMDTEAKLVAARFDVDAGTHASEVWSVQTPAPIVVGTTVITIEKTTSANLTTAEVQAARVGASTTYPTLGDHINAIEASVSTAVNAGVADLANIQEIIGCDGVPVTGSSLSAGVYVFSTPVDGTGPLEGVDIFCKITGTIKIQSWTKSGDDFTRKRSASVVIGSAGLHNLTPADFGAFPLDDGDYVGFYAPASLGAFITGAASSRGGYYNAAGDVSAFTDSATTTTVQLQVAFSVPKKTFSGEVFEEIGDDASYAAEAIDQIRDILAGSQIIGKTGTPATGLNISAVTYVRNEPATGNGIVDSVEFYSAAISDLTFGVFDKVGDVFTRVGPGVMVTSVVGLNTVAFDRMVIEPGQYLGATVGVAGGLTYINTADSLGYYNATAALVDGAFTDTAPSLNAQIQWKFTLKTLQALSHVSRWAAKNLAFFGDSITDIGTWHDQLCTYLGAIKALDVAVSGSGVAGLLTNVNSGSFTTIDAAIIFTGTNDYGNGMTLGTIADSTATTSFYGYYKKAIEQFLTWKPTLKIILMTPLRRQTMTAVGGGAALGAYVTAIKEIAALYACPVLDLHNVSGLNAINMATWTTDGLHPTAAGQTALIADPAKGFFDSI
ncbi:GDSL-type esterase/lipase family protein [Mesorhizobium muleiense]|uniref:SGNH/GDSL hydrolase family protein n=1 Tax=Mesorhizobium muleiense TaxID=1004279 RepID=UPI001F2B38D7|nr:GDSL-type esterase/lipase family protein [Mesorhizobium muleiense]MCF6120908.1 GDSL-type esterase/lipase family protein [Mesorhizobium muleiense]